MADSPACRICRQSNYRFAVSETIDACPLCVHCSGTDADVKEALSRASEYLAKLTNLDIAIAVKIAKGAQLRRRVRLGISPRPANRKKPAA